MAEALPQTPAPIRSGGRFLPLLLLMFAGSGCAALIYEIVWLQMLQLVVGSSAISLGVLLGIFMGGMCLGSLTLPRLVPRHWHPLKVYAALETGMALFGVAMWLVAPMAARAYAAHATGGTVGLLLRALVCGVCLLPPTLLMGATLPAISRWVEATPRGVSWLGFFYGGNTAGAVGGCLLAGFYLLRVYDLAVASYVAAGINLLVATASLWVARMPFEAPADSLVKDEGEWPVGSAGIFITIGLSGFCALGAEVVWTRLLSLMLGATVYTFSIILAVFLAGLGIGSAIGSVIGRDVARPRLALGSCQLLLTGAMAWTALMLAKSIPYWPVNPSLSSNPWFLFQMDLVRCLWAILPATILWGASFPLALAAVAGRGNDPARWVSRVYAANTVGAILGSLIPSLILIPRAGTQQTQRVLIALCGVSALVLFAPMLNPFRRPRTVSEVVTKPRIRPAVIMASLTGAVLGLGLVVTLVWATPELPAALVAQGRFVATKGDVGKVLFVGEGMNSSVAVTDTSDGARNFHVSGKVEASTDHRDMRLQRMLGHIPALLHPNPRSVLVVGCGAGVTAGTFVVHPEVQKITICELEPLIPRVVARFFSKENHNVLTDPRLTIVYDDARHYVLTTRDKFDIITSDPIHPWVKGAATLYTREYFELCKQHLNPGGLVSQWVPLYESNLGVVKSEIATFFEAFPNGTIWSNDDNGSGYDIILLGQVGTPRIDVDELGRKLGRRDHALAAQSLREVQFNSAVDLLATYAGRRADLGKWLEHAEINRDRNLRLQYLAGMASDLQEGEVIYSDMQLHRKFPADLFIAPNETLEALKRAMERGNPPGVEQ